MDVVAYCCASFAESTRRAAGVEPLTSPPLDAGIFDMHVLEGQDVLWFDLHGEPGAAWWFGDGGLVALTAGQIVKTNLRGTVVFAINCYLADDNSPMLDALLTAGARYVIGGRGCNWGGQRTLMGAGLLGMRVLMLLERGRDPLKALTLAKRWLMLKLVMDRCRGKTRRASAAQDALGFRAYYRRMT